MNQLRLLFRLHLYGSACMYQISERLQVSRPTATGMIDRLVGTGPVQRGPDAPDLLSEQGKGQVSRVRCAGAEAAPAALAQLGAAQRRAPFVALEPGYQLLFAGDSGPIPDE